MADLHLHIVKCFGNFPVDDLKGISDQVAKETYDVCTKTITDVFEVQANYQHMLLDVAKKGCYPYQLEQDPKYLPGCNLETLLSQVNVLASSTASHSQHSVRSILILKPCL